MKRLLLTRTRHDPTTHYIYEYCRELIEAAEREGWKVDKAEDEANNAKVVQSRLSRNSHYLVLFNGHGNEKCVLGHNNEVLVNTENASLLENKIVFSRTCASLKELGKQAVIKGCKAFVGYNDSFIFFTTNELESTPLKDQAAKPALEVSNVVALQLIDGHDAPRAVAAAKKKSVEWMTKMLASKEQYARQVFDSLLLNHLSLGCESRV